MMRFTVLALLAIALSGCTDATPVADVGNDAGSVLLVTLEEGATWQGASGLATIPAPELENAGIILIAAPSFDAAEASLLSVAELPGVAHVETDREWRLIDPVDVGLPVDVDRTRADAYALDPLVANQYQHSLTRSVDAWARNVHGRDAVIAIADTGIDCDHPDLSCVAGKDFTGSGGSSDGHGHGTHVAGIAGALGGNGVGGAGISIAARVMPVRVLAANGSGSTSWIAAGIVWAADNGAHVVNLSLGSPLPSPAMEQAVNYARGKGAVVVCAAGNAGNANPIFPAAYAGCVGVGATDSRDVATSWSSYGINAQVAAPGLNILSTCRGGGYCSMSGTSMASPVWAGAAALGRALGLTSAQVEADLRTLGDPASGTLAGLRRPNLDLTSWHWTGSPGPTPMPTIPQTAVIVTSTPEPYPGATRTTAPVPVPSATSAPLPAPVGGCVVVRVDADAIEVRCIYPRE